MTGWQRNPETRTWHLFPGGPYLFLSCCEEVIRTDDPLEPEPGSILVCQPCVKAMKRLVRKLEARKQ